MNVNPPTGAIPALRVHQWLDAWNDLNYDEENHAKPSEFFYLFSLRASQLRALVGIYTRSASSGTPRSQDTGIQRRHDKERSAEISHYVVGGYPWSTLGDVKRSDPENHKLRKPGWLPTAVVVNILRPGDERGGVILAKDAAISIEDQSEKFSFLNVPEPSLLDDAIPPIEIIDGQHRLFAFEEGDEEAEDYELPVVAFNGLALAWQAYLFWTINIKPKKINPSLAFDLYPLLREQEWLDSGESVTVYKESRAQELTEVLWSTPDNPWHRRINMLGGTRKENGPVTQAAFIRSLVASLVKSWTPIKGIGGLFGGTPGGSDGLTWSRIQQGAFLVTAWRLLADSVARSQDVWAENLRQESAELDIPGLAHTIYREPAFTSTYSLLATDQGVRGYQYVLNDLCYARHLELRLSEWHDDSDFAEVTPENIESMARTLEEQPVYDFLKSLCESLASYDWRTSGTPHLPEDARRSKAAMRGSGGYKEIRRSLLEHLRQSEIEIVSRTATLVTV
ncbi:hypothetical protein CH302_08700 [Rhodococcus sp. 15-2388-1-1a]|uniref:DGQHR domain-containing protein n=1 Tax=Nocardiaceae TaxID=85025 RepID=UPI0009E7E927|nr:MULTISPECIES: DGQHR domain-containing protein [Rhodococcus]OZF00929.1 hypothetical protein CH302_08700 [Rhodococcus sp. 15-2388-1-1a]